MDPTLEALEEAMAVYIQFIEERHADDAARRADEFAGLLLQMASGSWFFPPEFQKWKHRDGGKDRLKPGPSDV
jgi:hypothetical protein